MKKYEVVVEVQRHGEVAWHTYECPTKEQAEEIFNEYKDGENPISMYEITKTKIKEG